MFSSFIAPRKTLSMVSREWQEVIAAVIHTSSEAACLEVTCLVLLKGQWLFHQGNIFYSCGYIVDCTEKYS